MIMSLKIAILCLDTSLEMLWPLCWHRTHCLQGDLCRCLCEGSLQAFHVVVKLSARYVLQNSPQFTVQGFEVWTPQGPILDTDEVQKVPLQPLLSREVLALWAGAESCWKTHSWPLKRVMLRGFTTPCSTSSSYTQAPVSPLSHKNEEVSPPDGTPPTKPWHRKDGGLPAPSERISWDVRA